MMTTVDAVSFRLHQAKLQVLFYRRPCAPFQHDLALPSTQVNKAHDRCLADALLRIFIDYKLPTPAFSEQVITVGGSERDPRGWSASVVYFCLFKDEQMLAQEGWHWLDVAPLLQGEGEIAFDHRQLVTHAVERLKMKSRYSTLPVYLLGEEFTLSELQQAFEVILDVPLNRAAFRRRISRANLLEETGNSRTGNQRPAALYRRRGSGEVLFDQVMNGCAQ
ncbi:NUDIX hydrolase [Shewanella gelidii]|uniref:DNA mismatch repair protein MutT n=1 Tax=Shewanella gelidii TaxID=1642821 RepID=A0A917JRY2_9GAMM|nr:hypothetical protein [Shewanella gelidii]MCL1097786.1 hypothetical protein [Shewanella gelidii]GGI78775.1 DNA mismatch repair protein MutT [Shewanella gelidii]